MLLFYLQPLWFSYLYVVFIEIVLQKFLSIPNIIFSVNMPDDLDQEEKSTVKILYNFSEWQRKNYLHVSNENYRFRENVVK